MFNNKIFKGMKKITLLSAVLVAGMATAQVQVPMNMEIRKAEFKSIEMTAEVTMEEWNAEYVAKQQKAAAANYAAHDYYFTEGMMHFGYTPQFYGLQSSFIAVPYMDSVVWTNYYGPTNWYMQHNDSLVAENSETFVTGYAIDGTYYLPYTGDHTLTQNGKTYDIKGYKYAAGNENGGYLASAVAPIVISTGEMIPLTLCGMETDPMNNESGADFYQIGAGVRGAYAYGTKLIADTAIGVTADTLLSTVRNLSPLKISAVNIPVYNNQGTTIMPEGGQVKVELFAADLTQGIIYTDSVLGTAIATTENFLDLGGKMGTIVATFQEEDAFGGMMDVSILVEGDFVLQLTGYNESGCDFGIFADYYTPGGTTVYCVNGKYTPIFSASSNLAISYDAYWPAIQGYDGNVMTVAVEGGAAQYGQFPMALLETNTYYSVEEWIVDYPEWMTVEYGVVNMGTEEEPYYMGGFQVTADALTDGAGRQGVITINADGAQYELIVNQGDVTSGVEDVVAPMFDNKIYNLLGVEVDETYKGIVIKTGQKYIQESLNEIKKNATPSGSRFFYSVVRC